MRRTHVWALTLLLTTLVGSAGAAPGLQQVIVDSEYPSWLARANGKSVYICGPGDPEGFLYRGSLNADGTRNGDQQQIIDRLIATGANSMYVIAVRSHGGDGDATQNPFVNHDPNQGFDEELLDQWDGWLEQLDDAGVVVHFFLYDDSASIWNTGDHVSAEESAFVRGLVDRFEHHANLIWVVAEEYEERFSASRASALASEIRAADEHEHVVSIHQLSGLGFDFANDENIDQFALQYNVATREALHAGVVQAWNDANGEYQVTMAEAADWGTGAESRQKSWACAMGGANVMILGMDIATTPISDLEDCGRLVDFMESVPFRTMAPRDDLGAGDTEYVLADPGHSYVAYSASNPSNLGLTGLTPGDYFVSWFDCATGQRETEWRTTASGDTHSWPVPSSMGDEVAAWIFYIGPSGATDAPELAGFADELSLAAFPNPVRAGGAATLDFALTREQPVDLRVFDVRGVEVVNLLQKNLPNGSHTVRWDGRDRQRQPVGSGVYFVRLRAGISQSTTKVIVSR